MKLHGTMKYEGDELSIGGVLVSDLIEKYSSPLYVIDEEHIENTIKIFKENFVSEKFDTNISYASKAFLSVEMAKLIDRNKLSMDVVSGGELYIAHKAGFPMKRVHLHGNNKTNQEIEMALEFGIGEFIVDNEMEIGRIEALCEKLQKTANVLLRIDPGIDTHTHKYIRTSSLTSKFGMSIFKDDIFNIFKKVRDSKYLVLKGVHTHIGSQLFEVEYYFEELKEIFKFLSTLKEKFNIEIDMINIGGGFGIYYNSEDVPMKLENALQDIVKKAQDLEDEYSIGFKTLCIEPGRSIIGNAGSTIYTVGDIKETVGGKSYAFVDGGMSDNIRPALYQAKYECEVSVKKDIKKHRYTIAGKLCESGDILVDDVELQELVSGDYLVISSTGAYCYTMSSNYNAMLRPAVVFVKDASSRLAIKRQTYDDIAL